MSYVLVPFKRWHVDFLLENGSTEGTTFRPDEATLKLVEDAENSWTLVHGADPVACGGTTQAWPGRHLAWMLISKLAAPHMLAITRRVKAGLEGLKGRIELTVRHDFQAGHRWAKMLGFEVETPLLAAYGPAGEDHVGYVLFR